MTRRNGDVLMGTQTKERVDRYGFSGSPITDWCDGKCKGWVVPMRNGTCGWCDKKIVAKTSEKRHELVPA